MQQALVPLLAVQVAHGDHHGAECAGCRSQQQNDPGPKHGRRVIRADVIQKADQRFGHLRRNHHAEEGKQLPHINVGAAQNAGHADQQREEAQHQVISKGRSAPAHSAPKVQVADLRQPAQQRTFIHQSLQTCRQVHRFSPLPGIAADSRAAPPRAFHARSRAACDGAGERRPLRGRRRGAATRLPLHRPRPLPAGPLYSIPNSRRALRLVAAAISWAVVPRSSARRCTTRGSIPLSQRRPR